MGLFTLALVLAVPMILLLNLELSLSITTQAGGSRPDCSSLVRFPSVQP